jgi:ribosomal protein L37AE/L43A
MTAHLNGPHLTPCPRCDLPATTRHAAVMIGGAWYCSVCAVEIARRPFDESDAAAYRERLAAYIAEVHP